VDLEAVNLCPLSGYDTIGPSLQDSFIHSFIHFFIATNVQRIRRYICYD